MRNSNERSAAAGGSDEVSHFGCIPLLLFTDFLFCLLKHLHVRSNDMSGCLPARMLSRMIAACSGGSLNTNCSSMVMLRVVAVQNVVTICENSRVRLSASSFFFFGLVYSLNNA